MLTSKDTYVNHLALGMNCFIRCWYDSPDCYSIYEIKDLAYAYFISNLVSMLTDRHKCGDLKWFLFPIPETKEAHRIAVLPTQYSNPAGENSNY